MIDISSLVIVGIAVYIILFFFFFSSRRRHTRFDCDWSSDVCSSDLIVQPAFADLFQIFIKGHTPIDNHRSVRTLACTLFQCIQHFVQTAAVLHIRSEEHTSELQSQSNLVCRLLLEKKKKKQQQLYIW